MTEVEDDADWQEEPHPAEEEAIMAEEAATFDRFARRSSWRASRSTALEKVMVASPAMISPVVL